MSATQPGAWHILLVDDEEADYILTQSMLGQARKQAVALDWASSYEDGLQMLQKNRYDAVLVDYDLKIRTGIELIREAVAQDYPSPLILYSGASTHEADVEAMEAGATLYLAKDEANPLLLERSLRYAIERKRVEEALKEANQTLQNQAEELEVQAEEFTTSQAHGISVAGGADTGPVPDHEILRQRRLDRAVRPGCGLEVPLGVVEEDAVIPILAFLLEPAVTQMVIVGGEERLLPDELANA